MSMLEMCCWKAVSSVQFCFCLFARNSLNSSQSNSVMSYKRLEIFLLAFPGACGGWAVVAEAAPDGRASRAASVLEDSDEPRIWAWAADARVFFFFFTTPTRGYLTEVGEGAGGRSSSRSSSSASIVRGKSFDPGVRTPASIAVVVSNQAGTPESEIGDMV